jgi:hypothetical protein
MQKPMKAKEANAMEAGALKPMVPLEPVEVMVVM